jgi:hypothetical protein
MMAIPGAATAAMTAAATSTRTALTSNGTGTAASVVHRLPSADVSKYRIPAYSRNRSQRWRAGSYGGVATSLTMPATRWLQNSVLLETSSDAAWALSRVMVRYTCAGSAARGACTSSMCTSDRVRSYVVTDE